MTSPSIQVAVCQFAPGADPERNRAKVAELVRQAATSGARIAVLPEYSNYFLAPFDECIRQHAEPLDGPFVEHLRTLAAEYEITIVAGLLEASEREARPYNAAVAVDAAGVQAVYRKQHLYDAFGNRESDWLTQGPHSSPQTFEVAGVRFGMITCYDLRFPEAMRMVVDAGAEAVIVPAEWVSGPLKERHWNTLLAARAIENTVFVVASDHPAPIGVGLSQILAPDGTVLVSVSTSEAVALATLRMADLERTREANPALRLRRYRVVPSA
jgi:predicted amidohydrolase